jgi:hypothetical protein
MRKVFLLMLLGTALSWGAARAGEGASGSVRASGVTSVDAAFVASLAGNPLEGAIPRTGQVLHR